MIDLVNISVPNAAGYALLGYLVVFLGLVMLMLVIFLMGRIMTRKKAAPAPAPAAAAPAAAPAAPARQGGPGSRHRGRVQALRHRSPRRGHVHGHRSRHPRQAAQRAALYFHQGGQRR